MALPTCRQSYQPSSLAFDVVASGRRGSEAVRPILLSDLKEKEREKAKKSRSGGGGGLGLEERRRPPQSPVFSSSSLFPAIMPATTSFFPFVCAGRVEERR
ncbi:unnamed protein product [Linum trigynum]|uniref:Uncharacterized protein n=1 Tax=Linum trigynum TaxID=586398 RepID=A0AAV2ETU9_9ROSI